MATKAEHTMERTSIIQQLAEVSDAVQRMSLQARLSVINAHIKALNIEEAAMAKLTADTKSVQGQAEHKANQARAAVRPPVEPDVGAEVVDIAKPTITIDLYMIQSATERAKAYEKETVSKMQRLLVDDKDKEKRLKEGFCKWCWYRKSGAMTGQAFTKYTCRRCGIVAQHHNTGTPALCHSCGETGLCRGCCGDANGKQRRKVP